MLGSADRQSSDGEALSDYRDEETLASSGAGNAGGSQAGGGESENEAGSEDSIAAPRAGGFATILQGDFGPGISIFSVPTSLAGDVEAERGSANLRKTPLYLKADTGSITFSTRLGLSGKQKPSQEQGTEAPPKLPDFEAAFAKAAGEAKRLANGLNREAASMASDTKRYLSRSATQRRSKLGQSLTRLDSNLMSVRARLLTSVAGKLDNIEGLRRQIKSAISAGARSARGHLQARRIEYDRGISPLSTRKASLYTTITDHEHDVVDAGDAASDAMQRVNSTPSELGLSSVTAKDRAIKEAVEQFAPARALTRKQNYLDMAQRHHSAIAAAFRCLPCKLDTAFAGVQGYVDQVSIAGPAHVDEVEASGKKTLRRSVRQLREMVIQLGQATDESLVNQHNATRDLMIESAGSEEKAEAGIAQARVEQVVEKLQGQAQAQPMAIDDIRETLAEYQNMDAALFANEVIKASAKLAEQITAIDSEEPDKSRKMVTELLRGLVKQAVASELATRVSLGQTERQRQDAINNALESMTETIGSVSEDLSPLGRQAREAAGNFLPDLTTGYNNALAGLNNVVADSEDAAAAAMEGQPAPAPRENPGGGGGDASGEAATPPVSCTGCGDTSEANMSTENPDANMSMAPPTADGSTLMCTVSGPNTPMSPAEFVSKANDIGATPAKDDSLKQLIDKATKEVPKKLNIRVAELDDGMDIHWANVLTNADIPKMLKQVEGITAIHGEYLTEGYGSDTNGWGLRTAFHFWADAELSMGSTISGYKASFDDSMRGDASEAAMNRLRSAFVLWNDTTGAMETLQSLTPQQMDQLARTHPNELAELASELGLRDREEFNALLANNPALARAMDLKSGIDRARATEGVTGWERTQTAIRDAEHAAGGYALEGNREYAQADLFGLEDPDATSARQAAAWQETQAQFSDVRGVTLREGGSSDMAGSVVLDYATRTITHLHEQRGEHGELISSHTTTDEFGADHRRTVELMLRHGSDSDEAAASELVTEMGRNGGRPPRHDVLDRTMHSAGADAAVNGGYGADARAGGLQEAQERRMRVLALYEQYRTDGTNEEPRPTDEVATSLELQIRQAFRDDPVAADYHASIVSSAQGDPLAAIEYAIDNENLDVAKRQLGRMDRTEIDQLMRDYATAHPNGPSLERALGIGSHRFNINDVLVPLAGASVGIPVDTDRLSGFNASAAFSGDEASEIEILMHGVPQNDFEAGMVAQRVMDQQIEQSTWAGRFLANSEYNTLVHNAGRLREMMGTSDVEVDSMGRISAVDPETGQPVIAGHFNARGEFTPPSGFDVGDFATATGLARFYATNYTEATDRVANYIATAIVITAAIVTTALTGGAGASIWIPVLVTLGAGMLAMGTTAMIKGSRYTKDQIIADLANNIVQAATAGIGAGVGAALRGGAPALKGLATTMRLSEQQLAAKAGSAVALRSLGLAENIAIGAGSGALAGGVNAAADMRAYRGENYGSNIIHGIMKGALGGAIGAGVTQTVAGGVGRLARRFGNRQVASRWPAPPVCRVMILRGLLINMPMISHKVASSTYWDAR